MLTKQDGQPAQVESLHAAQLFDVTGLMAVITGGGTGKSNSAYPRGSPRTCRLQYLPCADLFCSASGIGLMMAQALAQNGATVFIIGRRADVLERAVKENTYVCLFHLYRASALVFAMAELKIGY
jgi:hypothetical protein